MQEPMKLESDKYSLKKKITSEFMFQCVWDPISRSNLLHQVAVYQVHKKDLITQKKQD